jgi:HSP20 family protein
MEVMHLMSSERRNRRERRPFDVFEEFKEIEDIMRDIMRQAYGKNKRIGPRFYVFSIRKEPRLRGNSSGWTNVNRQHRTSWANEQKEALVDVFDKKDEIVVVAKLPNVKKDDIELHRSGNLLNVSVNKAQRNNFKTIVLPAKVNVEDAKINYKNGVLEVTLPKIEKDP